MNRGRFDKWAGNYDESVSKGREGYPFEGYYEVLDRVRSFIDNVRGKKILDIGVGTGFLTYELYEEGAEIVGIDFSKEMIEKAKEKMPRGVFFLHDINEGIPDEICNMRFDFIVSSYAMHHVDDESKLNFITSAKEILREGGKIIIADVAFQTAEGLEKCKTKHMGDWDEKEYYIVAEKLCKELNKCGLQCDHLQISSCAGVLVVR